MPRRKDALPKLWRKRKGKKGPYAGNYICKVNGNEVNLRTQVLDGPDGAIERSKQALAGKRSFKSDTEKAADAMETAPPAPAIPASSAPPPDPPPPAAPAAAPAPAAAAPPPAVAPDAVLPPPRLLPPISTDAAEEAAATSAAAAETADQAGAGGGAGDEIPEISPDVLDELLAEGAAMIVDLQLGMQAALIKRRTGKIAGPIQEDSKIRTFSAKAWVAQLKIWFPADMMLKPWMIAIGLPILAMRVQLRDATDPPKKDEGAAAAPAAAGVDIPAAA